MSEHSTDGALSAPGTAFWLWRQTLPLSTKERVEFLDVTPRIAAAIARSGVREGIAHLASSHTTLALFVNEPEPALLSDLRRLLEALARRGDGWRHDDPAQSDCDRRNADAHLRAVLLGHAVSVPVSGGALALGTFQSVLAAELDGPRQRTLELQLLGCR